jgi:NTP pyrophosphatase (non-canonical NTP hydrolase)
MSVQPQTGGGLTLSGLQQMILQMYGQKDAARGDAATFLWLTEEFGELATALRSGTDEELAAEMADVLAWLATLANIRGIELETALSRKYGCGCPGCHAVPCVCDAAEKP